MAGPNRFFSVASGGVVCADCRVAGSVVPSPQALELLGALLTGDWETTDAVEDFQKDRGLDETGTLKLGTIVFRPQATRIASGKATVGDSVSPGRPLAEISSTRRVITVNRPPR